MFGLWRFAVCAAGRGRSLSFLLDFGIAAGAARSRLVLFASFDAVSLWTIGLGKVNILIITNQAPWSVLARRMIFSEHSPEQPHQMSLNVSTMLFNPKLQNLDMLVATALGVYLVQETRC